MYHWKAHDAIDQSNESTGSVRRYRVAGPRVRASSANAAPRTQGARERARLAAT